MDIDNKIDIEIDNMEKLSAVIKDVMDNDGKSNDDVFEMVSIILLKSRKKCVYSKKRRAVCRPVLLISDSSGDD
jgi:hypothetical protein